MADATKLAPMRWKIGTMGFSYPAWSGGVFYPRGVKPADYLAYYAKCFDAVELDTTFYAIPAPDRVRRWASAVGPDFRFSLKTPRDITHADDVSAAAAMMASFVTSVREFGEKLGVILLQFPPSFDARRFRELQGLLATIPTDIPLCAEFRHASWWAWGDTAQFLADYNVSWASADYVSSPRELRVVGHRAYLRLIGEHDRYPNMYREERDPTADLQHWKSELDRAAPEEVWVLLNNDYAGFSIATAERLLALLGRQSSRPIAVETTLFG